jgi:hypothetical protein
MADERVHDNDPANVNEAIVSKGTDRSVEA